MTHQEVTKIMRQIGLRPQKAAGQNFLLDESVTKEMVDIAEINKNSTVLEIGPGLGVLTQPLVATGAHVIGIELDKRLAPYLRHRFKAARNFQLLEGDVFKFNLHDYVQDFKYSVVANLPYGVTSLLFRNLLTLSPRPTRITAMIQKEVAERMVAEPGEMSLLSLMMHYYATPTFVMTVPKTSFWPAPEVTSAVIDVQVTNPPPAADEGKALFRVAKAAFSGRRKTILNSLLASFPQEKANLSQKIEKAGLSPTARPQDLSLQNWIELSKVLI